MIIPAILVSSFDEFADQVKKLEKFFKYAQIDVMDGVFVENKSFAEIEKINTLATGLKFELHLMVEHPLAELEKWKNIKNVFRAIFHIEAKDGIQKCIDAILKNGWQAGIAVNPETPLTAIEPYYKLVDIVMFMTVNPGRHGAPYLPEVGGKIREYMKLANAPVCAVDGGIDEKNIDELKSIGVKIFNIGSKRAVNFI